MSILAEIIGMHLLATARADATACTLRQALESDLAFEYPGGRIVLLADLYSYLSRRHGTAPTPLEAERISRVMTVVQAEM